MTSKWVIQLHVQRGIFFALRRLVWNLLYQFRPQGFLKIAGVKSVWGCWANRWQSMNGFCVVIDWSSIGRYQLTNFIDWYRLIDWISDQGFLSIEYPGTLGSLLTSNQIEIQRRLHQVGSHWLIDQHLEWPWRPKLSQEFRDIQLIG